MRGIVPSAFVLVALTVVVHAVGLIAIIKLLTRPGTRVPTGLWPTAWVLIRMTWLLVLVHVAEIAVWAGFYYALGSMPDAGSALYFSGVTYTTVGYGDLVLPQQWRLLGPVEALTGILMCGLSTGFFFAVLSRLFGPLFGDIERKEP
jgi:hypothetical protein